jgi:hypothetical protein
MKAKLLKKVEVDDERWQLHPAEAKPVPVQAPCIPSPTTPTMMYNNATTSSRMLTQAK